MFGILVGERRELDGEGVVVVVEFEATASIHGGIGDLIIARHGVSSDGKEFYSSNIEIDGERYTITK